MRHSTPSAESLLEALQPANGWKIAYAAVKDALLATTPVGVTFSTEQLVESIAPAAGWIHGERETRARRRVYRALTALAANDLAAWVTVGAPEPLYGRAIRRKIWKRPGEKARCRHCNGTGYAID